MSGPVLECEGETEMERPRETEGQSGGSVGEGEALPGDTEVLAP